MLPWDTVTFVSNIRDSQQEIQVPSSNISQFKVENERIQYVHSLLTKNAILFEIWQKSSLQTIPCDIITTDWGQNIQKNCKKCASILYALDWMFLSPSNRNSLLASVILQELITRDAPNNKVEFSNSIRTINFIFNLNPALASNKQIGTFLQEKIFKPFLSNIQSVCDFSIAQVETIAQLPTNEQTEETVLSIMQWFYKSMKGWKETNSVIVASWLKKFGYRYMEFLLDMRSDDDEKTRILCKEIIEEFGDFFVSITDMDGKIMKNYRVFDRLLIQESSYFQKMLNTDMSEANSRQIKLVAENEDWESLIIEYIITGNAAITQQNCWEIYMCSDRYDMPKLKAIAEESLTHTMSFWGLEDVIKFWELLEEATSSSALRDATFKRIGECGLEMLEKGDSNGFFSLWDTYKDIQQFVSKNDVLREAYRGFDKTGNLEIINSLLSRNLLQEGNSTRVINFVEAAYRGSHFTTANHLLKYLKDSDVGTILDPGRSSILSFNLHSDIWNGKLEVPMQIMSQRTIFQQLDKKSTEIFIKLVTCCIEQSNTEFLKILLKEVKISKSVPLRQRFDWMVITQNILNTTIEKSDVLLLQYLLREHSFKPSWLIRSFDLLSENFEKLAKIVNLEKDPLTNTITSFICVPISSRTHFSLNKGDITSFENTHPLQMALEKEDDKAAEVLMGSSLDLKLISSKNIDMILLAVKKGRLDILKALQEKHGDDFIEQLVLDFNQAIALATSNSRTDIISFIQELSKKENENNTSEKKKKGILSLFAKK